MEVDPPSRVASRSRNSQCALDPSQIGQPAKRERITCEARLSEEHPEGRGPVAGKIAVRPDDASGAVETASQTAHRTLTRRQHPEYAYATAIEFPIPLGGRIMRLPLLDFLAGAASDCYLSAAVDFPRFCTVSRLGADNNRAGYPYVLRVTGFLLILYAIIRKNLAAPRG